MGETSGLIVISFVSCKRQQHLAAGTEAVALVAWFTDLQSRFPLLPVDLIANSYGVLVFS